jgi:hypothetical protein
VVAPEPTSAGRCGPKLQLTWQRVDAHLAPCLDLELVYRGTGLQGTDNTCCSLWLGLLSPLKLGLGLLSP